MGSQLPLKRGTAPEFSVHVYCGQTDGWMKTPLGTEVDLSPGYIVLDWDPAAPRKGHSRPLNSVHVYCGHGRPSQLLLSSCCVCLTSDEVGSVKVKIAGPENLYVALKFCLYDMCNQNYV